MPLVQRLAVKYRRCEKRPPVLSRELPLQSKWKLHLALPDDDTAQGAGPHPKRQCQARACRAVSVGRVPGRTPESHDPLPCTRLDLLSKVKAVPRQSFSEHCTRSFSSIDLGCIWLRPLCLPGRPDWYHDYPRRIDCNENSERYPFGTHKNQSPQPLHKKEALHTRSIARKKSR